MRTPLIMLLGLCGLCGLQAAAHTRADENVLTFSRFVWSAKADLGEVTLSYSLTPDNKSADVGVQIYAHRDDIVGHEQYDLIVPAKDSAPPVLNLFKGIANNGTLKIVLPKGQYGACRILLFRSPEGQTTDFNGLLYDTLSDPMKPAVNLHLNIKTPDKRITAPTLAILEGTKVRDNGDGTYVVTIPAVVKVPLGFTIQDNGFWAMAKGPVYFSQVWAPLDKAAPGADPNDSYQKIPIEFELKDVKPGLSSVQFGLFKPSFGDPLQWIFPGQDFEAGGDAWEVRAPVDKIPPRLRVRNRKFERLTGDPFDFYADSPAGKKAVTFVRGGNYGNAITWKVLPELDKPGYFELLKEAGCRYLRFNFNPNRFTEEPLYQHAVDQVIQNMWAAGVYPILCPQDLPEGDTLDERVEKGFKVVRAMAVKYRGKSVWLEVCNEPHEFATWEAWKPVAVRYAKAIRAIDPDAFVIVPFEGFSKDGRGAAKSPITEAAVDLYDGHAYVDPSQVAALFGPPIKAGLPEIIGEYGGGADYLAKIDQELQKLSPGLIAAGPWAFTIKGDDSLPLVANGATATLSFTPAGQVIASDYALWDAGKKRP